MHVLRFIIMKRSSISSAEDALEMKWCIRLWIPFLRIWSQGHWGSSKYSGAAEVATCRCHRNKIWLMFSWIMMLASQSNEIFVLFDQSAAALIETPSLVLRYVYSTSKKHFVYIACSHVSCSHTQAGICNFVLASLANQRSYVHSQKHHDSS